MEETCKAMYPIGTKILTVTPTDGITFGEVVNHQPFSQEMKWLPIMRSDVGEIYFSLGIVLFDSEKIRAIIEKLTPEEILDLFNSKNYEVN